MHFAKSLTLFVAAMSLTLSAYAEQQGQSEKTSEEAKQQIQEQVTDDSTTSSDQEDKEARIQAQEILRQMQKKLSTQ